MGAQQRERVSHEVKGKRWLTSHGVEKEKMLRGVCLRFSGIGPANSVVTCHPAIIYFYLYKQLLLEKVTGEAFRNMTWAASLGKCLQPAQTKLSPNAAVFVEAICPWSLLYCLCYTATLSHSFLSLFLFFPELSRIWEILTNMWKPFFLRSHCLHSNYSLATSADFSWSITHTQLITRSHFLSLCVKTNSQPQRRVWRWKDAVWYFLSCS